MTNKPSTLSLGLDEHQVSALIDISLISTALYRHDITGPLGAIGAAVDILLQRRDESEDQIDAIVQMLETSHKILRHRIYLIPTFTGRMLIFRASLSDTVEALLRELEDKFVMEIDERVSDTPDLVFPSNTIFLMLHELLCNVLKHNPASSGRTLKIKLECSFDSPFFSVSVHDNGKIAWEEVGSRFRPVIAMLKKRMRFEGRTEASMEGSMESGMNLVHRILVRCNGELLVRRSNSLGGNEFHIRFPVVGHWRGDELLVSGFCYANR